jgi:hypothetical protein
MDTLDPGSYVISQDQPLKVSAALKSRRQLVKWIDRCVLGDLRTLRDGIRQAERDGLSRKRGGGNFLLAAGCCMALEYLAFVFSGNENATASIRRYADAFLRPIDGRYGLVVDLMWRSFRNGLIHGSWPQPIACLSAPGDVVIVGVGNELADEHLAPIRNVKGISFGVSAPRLLRDLEKSFKPGFRDWVLHNAPDSVLKRGAPKLLELHAKDELGRRQLRTVRSWHSVVSERTHR